MKIGFITLTNPERPAPSTRVAVLNMLPYLQGAGHATAFVHSVGGKSLAPELPATLADDCVAQGFDVVAFQKVQGPSAIVLARELERRGIRTVYLVCDIVSAEMCEATSATLAVTDYLRGLYPAALRHKVSVVHDGIERPEVEHRNGAPEIDTRERPLRAVLVTAQGLDHVPVLGNPLPPWLRLRIVGRYPPARQRLDRARAWRWALQRQPDTARRLDYLRFALDPRIRRVAWDPDGVYDELCAADVGIIPIETDDVPDPGAAGAPSWKVRSENRLTLKMALGLPVVATPIPAYLPVIEQGVNGFLATSTDDWRRSLDALRDPALRRDIGAAARRSVLQRYSKERQAEGMIAVLTQVLAVRDA